MQRQTSHNSNPDVARASSGLVSFGLDAPSQISPTNSSAGGEPAFFVDQSFTDLPPAYDDSYKAWLHKLLIFTGPGWLMSIAYVDPGNLEADLQCGAQFGYSLLWALLGSTLFGLAMQLTAARLGCATRRNLAELCRENYAAPHVRYTLWVVSELAIISSDIQEVIGCSIGLKIMFGLPLALGVLITALAAFCFLFLERLGVRKLELFFGGLILILASSMAGLFVAVEPDDALVLEGFVIPYMPNSAVQQVVGMVGCVVMPHNLYLHSALVQSRVIDDGAEKEAIFLFTIESSIAIFVTLLINMFVIAVFAKGFFNTPAAAELGLLNAGDYLGDTFGNSLKMIWALGLIAAGQSSTMTGAYAGQWVMQGYLNLQVAPWKRAIVTRTVALIPCLTVALYFGDGTSGLDTLNEYLNVVQSLVLPFVLVPLITLASSEKVMGHLALSTWGVAMSWLATSVLMIINIYLFLVEFWPRASADVARTVVFVISLLSYGAMLAHIKLTPLQSSDSSLSISLLTAKGRAC